MSFKKRKAEIVPTTVTFTDLAKRLKSKKYTNEINDLKRAILKIIDDNKCQSVKFSCGLEEFSQSYEFKEFITEMEKENINVIVTIDKEDPSGYTSIWFERKVKPNELHIHEYSHTPIYSDAR